MRTRAARLLLTLGLAWLNAIAPPAWSSDDGSVSRSGAVPGDTTTTTGSIPKEIAGRWVAIIEVRPMIGGNQAGGGSTAIVRTFEVTEVDDGLALNLHRGQLPESLKQRLDPRTVAKKAPPGASKGPAAGSAASAGNSPGSATPSTAPAGTPQSGATSGAAPPDAETLAEVGRAWPGLLAPDSEPRTVASRLINYDEASPEEKEQMGLPDTRFLITLDEQFRPTETSPRQSVTTLAVGEIGNGRMTGKSLQAIVLPARMRGDTAFPPVPVAFGGDFVAYRVPDSSGGTAPSASAGEHKGVLDRVLGMFSGCGG